MKLTEAEILELQKRARARTGRADSARHARLILLLAEGLTWAEIRSKLDCSDSFIDRWSTRFAQERLAGLFPRHAGRERYKVTDDFEARVLAHTTGCAPADGSKHWSTRKLAAELGGGVSHMTVARIWAKHGIQPDRLAGGPGDAEAHLAVKSVDVIGLYRNAPAHAAVFGVDESVPGHPASARARAARRGPVQVGQGMRSLQAALDAEAGDAPVAAARHTSAEFVAFLTDIVANQPGGRAIHVVAGEAAARKSRPVDAFLGAHPRVRMHFSATRDAWLDQVEPWFAAIERDIVATGASPVPEVEPALMRHLRQDSWRPAPVKWKYVDPGRQHTIDPGAASRLATASSRADGA
jgi:transposase